MGNSNYAFTKRNEYGDEFTYKSGTGSNQRWVGTRVCLGKREKRTFVGDNRSAVEEWAEWSHECDREAPKEEPTPVVPSGFRVKEEELAQRVSDETRAEIEELLEVGDMTQKESAEAYGLCQATVSRINKQLEEKRARHEERQRTREEERVLREQERALREQERERDKPEPLPDNFKPRQSAPACGKYYAIAESGQSVTLFSDQRTAAKVAAMINGALNGSWEVEVVECSFFEEG